MQAAPLLADVLPMVSGFYWLGLTGALVLAVSLAMAMQWVQSSLHGG